MKNIKSSSLKSLDKNLNDLLQILSNGDYHTESSLSEKLKLDLSAVRKSIKQLKILGINAEVKPNLGYRIPRISELLDKKIFAEHINKEHNISKKQIHTFNALSSTSDYLIELIKDQKHKHEKYICLAETQIQGRGSPGKAWVSPFAQNIYLSLLWQFIRTPQELNGLGLVIAIAIIEALEDYGIKKNLGIKWPNDVFWEKKKLAGILIELFSKTHRICNTVIGIGLNINMQQSTGQKISQPWCDIAQITKTTPNRNILAGLLLDKILYTLEIYQKHGLKPFIKKWQELDITYGKKITVVAPLQEISGTSMGINENGHFLLKNDNNEILSFASGEISLKF